uniref:NADH-ubiquinone oxidoreductase chain 6 n=1 Tax=Chikila fulleri TaxID=928324 RepID=R4H0H2_CHIFU|nr:NADH dehydrogenase subunit 6 [Chikila fulleri]ADR03267.1 NADH dehydrogenase subunit 6 [Chikila fulleri]
MSYMVGFGLISLVLGLVAVASNPSPYFGALGLVVAAVAGCLVLISIGVGFVSLILFLIYLGGMLVVFAYSAAMAAEPYPEAWGNWHVSVYLFVYLCIVMVGLNIVEDVDGLFMFEGFGVLHGDWGGVAMLYEIGGWMLLIAGWILLLTLFIVLELTRGMGIGSLQAV